MFLAELQAFATAHCKTVIVRGSRPLRIPRPIYLGVVSKCSSLLRHHGAKLQIDPADLANDAMYKLVVRSQTPGLALWIRSGTGRDVELGIFAQCLSVREYTHIYGHVPSPLGPPWCLYLIVGNEHQEPATRFARVFARTREAAASMVNVAWNGLAKFYYVSHDRETKRIYVSEGALEDDIWHDHATDQFHGDRMFMPELDGIPVLLSILHDATVTLHR